MRRIASASNSSMYAKTGYVNPGTGLGAHVRSSLENMDVPSELDFEGRLYRQRVEVAHDSRATTVLAIVNDSANSAGR